MVRSGQRPRLEPWAANLSLLDMCEMAEVLEDWKSQLRPLGAAESGPMPIDQLSRRKAVFLFFIAAVAWGTAWPVMKAILEYLPPLWMTAFRSAIAVVALFTISIFQRRLVLPKKGDLPVVLNIAILHMTMFCVLIAVGLQFVPAGQIGRAHV